MTSYDVAAVQPVAVPPSASAVVLELTVEVSAEDDLRSALTDLTGIVRAVRFRAPEADVSCVVGIGSDLWDRLFPELRRPAGLHPFAEVRGRAHVAPSTPGDLVLHVRAARMDLGFELARHLRDRLGPAVSVVEEVPGFRYFDQRDLLGFVDGTESPVGPEADQVVTVVDDPGYEGSSYFVVQQYRHDLEAWNALPVEQQEAAIGRRKLDDIEIPDNQKAANAHAALTSVTDADGEDRKIVRENMPFGRISDGTFGTCFLGYCADPAVIEVMLHRMFVGEPEGNHDRILDFSTAETGSLYFVPTADFLDDPSGAPRA